MVTEYEDRPNSEEFSLQGYGGLPKATQGFSVKEKPAAPRPDSHDSWNTNMGNPVGPK